MRKICFVTILTVLSTIALKSNAQDGFDELIKSNAADASLLFRNYANPLLKGFGVGLNSGWNNTAATKKLLHFELRITANAAFVPDVDKSFNVTQIGLSNRVELSKDSPTPIAQTFGGNKNAANPVMDIYDNNNTKLSSFTMPEAIMQVIPAPTIQLTAGLIKNTDVTLRITPDIKISDDAGKVGMFGIGFKHNIIKDFVKLSPFDLAVAVNYNRLKYTKTLNVANEDGTSNAGNNQRIDATFSGVNVQAILSKKVLFFTPFVSVAFQTANTNMGVLGNYVVRSGAISYTTLVDPVKIDEKSVSGLRTDLGFQLNLAVLRIYASGSVGEYKSVNAGIGIGF